MLRKYKTYSYEEVIITALNDPNYKYKILEMLEGNEAAYYLLQIHYNKRNKYSIEPDLFEELESMLFEDYHKENFEESVESGPTMSGADPAAYPPDGNWSPEMFEFLGFYFWREPEGEEYGYFKSSRTARSFGRSNWWGTY